MLDLVFLLTVISLHRNDYTLMGFQKDSYYAIERLTIEDRKTKTTIIILANQKKHKLRQSDHGENLREQVTKLNLPRKICKV